MDETPDVRIFLSFDVEHDTDLGDRLSEESLATGSGFHVVSRSDAEQMTDGWRDGVRRRVRDADEVIVICSEYTAASARVSMELRIAHQEQKPCLLLWGRRGRMCSMPFGVEQDACMYTWTRETLVHQIAQTLRDALWKSHRSGALAQAGATSIAPAAAVSSVQGRPIAALALAFWLGSPAAIAQEHAAELLPVHAHAAPYGAGWECDRGYRRQQETCVRIELPSHAFLSASGSDWECERGYRATHGLCAPIEVPANAHLDARGRGWTCDRGYRNAGPSCVPVQIPPHAYLVDSDWRCDRGFRKVGGSCEPVIPPAHAYLAASGEEWTCERGFRRTLETCVLLELPTQAHLVDAGNDWDCARGYERRDGSCVAVALPENAHLSSSGHGWSCDSGYLRRDNGCSR